MIIKVVDKETGLGGKGFESGIKFKIPKEYTGASKVIDDYNKKITKANFNVEAFLKNHKDANFQNYIKGLDKAEGSMDGYKASLKGVTIGSKLAAGSVKAMGIAMNMALTMGISLVLQEAVTWISKLVTAQQDAIDKADELTSAYESSTNEINSNVSSLQELEKEFKSLSKGVDENGKNIGLSTERYERYKDIVGQIVDISPKLINGYNDEGLALVDKNTVVQEAIDLQKELNEAKKAEYLATGAEVLEGARGEVKKATDVLGLGGWNPKSYANEVRDVIDNLVAADVYGVSTMDYDSLGIDKFKLRDGNPEEVEKLIQTQDSLMVKLKEEYGLTEEKEQKLRNILDLMDIELDKIDSAKQKVGNILSLWASSESNQDWYPKIQTGYLDEFSSQLAEIGADGTKSYEELQVAAKNLGKDFLEIQDQIPTKEFEDLKAQLSDGKITPDEFNTSLTDLLSILDTIKTDSPEIQAILELISKGWRDFSETDIEPSVKASIEVLAEDLKKAREETDKLITSAKTLSSAFAEQKENGQLSAESILSITDAGYASALQVNAETGIVTLNADAYIRLAKAKMEEHLATLMTNRNTIKQQLDNETESVNHLTNAYNNSRDAMILAQLAEHKTTRDGLQSQYDNANAEAESILAIIKNINNITSGTYGISAEEIAKKKKDLAVKQAESQKKLDELATQNRLDLLKHELEEKKELIEKYNADIELLNLELELNNGLSNTRTMENLSTKFDTMIDKGKALKTEFEYLSDLQPTTAAEAQAIADRITQVGKDIRANLIDLNKIRQEIDIFRVDVINQQVASRSEMASREFELLDQNMKLIQDRISGKESLFGNNLMPFDFLLPTVSKTAIEKKEKETEKLIAEEQRRQDEINRIVKEATDKQLKENQKMRSEEAAKIVSDMQEVQNELKKIIENPNFDTSKYRELGKSAGKEFSDGFNENAKVAKSEPPSTASGQYGQKAKSGDTSSEKLFDIIKNNDKGARLTQGAGIGSHNSEYGWQNAIDVAGIETAEAVAAGKVVFAGWKAGNSYGRHVVVHDDQNAYIYAHLASINDNIKVGETVGRGTELGIVGGSSAASGKLVDNAYGKHLHLQKAPLRYYKDPLEARARGGITTQDEVLVGEEGKELAVLPNGRKVMLGANGAELVNLPIGTHIYNNDDTNEIIKYTGSDVEHSTVIKYAKGTGSKKPPKMKEDEKKKILDKLDGMNLDPQTLYSKEFSNTYLKNQKNREKAAKEIESLNKKIASGKNVKKNTALRNQKQAELDLSDVQATSDLMKTSAESNFAYYKDLRSKTLKEFNAYIDKVNKGTVAFDSEVNAAYIDSIGTLNDELVKSNEEFQKSQEILNQITDTALGDLDKYLDGITHDLQKQSEEYDSQISKQQALLEATKSHYNYTRQLKEESIEYSKQMRITQALSGLLTAEEIRFHFNMGDFEKFNSVIGDIQGGIDLLTAKYKADIASLGEDELYKAEKITAEYNAQMEAEMKKLNIAKAEYSVSKAKQDLEKVKKQRDTLMFTGDKWEYVADFEKVADATENLVQAEEDLGLSEFDRFSQDNIDKEASNLYSTQQQKAALDNQINIINKAGEDLKYEYNKYLNPVKDLGGIIDALGTVDFPAFQKALTKFKNTINSFSIGGSTSGAGDIGTGNGGGTSGAGGGSIGIPPAPSVGNSVVIKSNATGYTWDESKQAMIKNTSKSPNAGKKFVIDKVSSGGGYVKDKNWGWFKLDEIVGYAKGTQNAKAGLAQFDEEGNGTEALFKQTSSGNFTMMKQGDQVFSKADMGNLWRLVKDPESNILSNLVAKQFQPKIDIPHLQPTPQQVNHTLNFGDLSFPNIKGIDEAELFTKQLGGLVNKAIQKAYSSR